MNKSVIAKVLGLLLIFLGLIAFAPCVSAIYSKEPILPWLEMTGVFWGSGFILIALGWKSKPQTDLGIREGIAITSLFWLISSAIAAIGIWSSHTHCTYIQAWFESMSGFTTTGASIFGAQSSDDPYAIAQLNNSALLWRAMLQWMGGIGIVVISIALIPLLIGNSGFQMYRAEMPGFSNSKLAPRLATTARIILGLYLVSSIIIAFALIICGVPPFHAVCHAMCTVSTGGFSTYDNNIEGLQSIGAEWIIIGAMLLSAINFSLLVTAIRNKPLDLLRNTETKYFLICIGLAWCTCMGVLLLQSDIYTNDYHDLIRDSLFHVISMGSTTGFFTGLDDNPGSWGTWPSGCLAVLFLLMIVGGCAGSTAGGLKVIRMIISYRAARREMNRFMEPSRVTPIELEGRLLNDRTIYQVCAYLAIYLITVAIGILCYCLLGNDLSVSCSASISCVSNIGPGLGSIGPGQNFRGLNDASLLISILLMLLGRLELIGILMTLRPKHWR